jgi:hypothetical protein
MNDDDGCLGPKGEVARMPEALATDNAPKGFYGRGGQAVLIVVKNKKRAGARFLSERSNRQQRHDCPEPSERGLGLPRPGTGEELIMNAKSVL